MAQSADEFFSFTPAKRDTPWGKGKQATVQEPIRLPEGSLIPSDPEVRQGLEEVAAKYQINPALLMALGHQESAYNPNAEGPQTKWGTAKGMFQFLDSTAKGHGIDPLDWRQAAEAAAKDLATQIAREGVDWAVAHHHGGPNRRLHGRKTAQYTQEVLAKAQAIAQELGIPLDIPEGQMPSAASPSTSDSPTPMPAEKFFDSPDFSNVRTSDGGERFVRPPEEESFTDTLRGVGARAAAESPSGINPVAGAVLGGLKRTVARGWEGFQDFLNRETEQVTLTDAELRREWEQSASKSRQATEYGLTFEQWAENNRTRTVTKKPFEQEEAEWAERLKNNPEDAYLLPKRLAHLRPETDTSRFAPADTFKGFAQRFIAGHKNPVDLMLQDSIPANIVTALFTLPETERKKFDQMREVTRALEIQDNPEKFDEGQREQAKAVLQADADKRDPSIMRAWKELWQAAKEDPSRVAIGFTEALAADPYMIAAPIGVGMQPIRLGRVMSGLRSTTTAGRAAKVADRILDGSLTTAALNVGAGVAANLAEFGEINDAEVKLNAAMGVIMGGTLAPIFMRGAKARAKSINAHRAEGTLEEAIADVVKSEMEMETLVRESVEGDPDYNIVQSALNRQESIARQRRQQQISELLGIKTPAEAEAWIKQRRKEVKDWFNDNAEYADYQALMADERIARATKLAEEAEARRRSAAEAAYGAVPEDAAARSARLQKEFDDAINARNAAAEADTVAAAEAENAAREIADRLNAEEMYYAMLSEDSPTIRQAEAKIKRRNDQLGRHRRKRNELGSADPETLARVGAVGLGAAAGTALFPEDEKLAGGILGGLAGLVVPAGGSVLSRMKQAGAISSEGQIIAALVKAGKMANKLDEAEIKARDKALVEATRAGDQLAFKKLYDTYKPQMQRYAKKFTENRESATGVDNEDIAQRAMLNLYQKIISDPEFVPDNVPAFLHTITKNEAIKAVEKSQTLKREADVVNESQYYKEDMYEGDRGGGRSILDDTYGGGLVEGLEDTPETIAMRDDAMDIIRQAVDSLPSKQQEVFTLVNLQHFTPEEAAKELGISHDNVRQILSRAEKLVRRSIEENRRRLGTEPDPSEFRGPRGQRGSASVEDLTRVAALASVAAGAGTAGYFLFDGDIWRSGLLGAGAAGGTALASKAGFGKLLRGLDYRLKDFGEAFYGLAKKHGYQELKRIREFNNDTADFITTFKAIPKDVQPIVVRALSTRKTPIINRVLEQVGGSEFVKAFDKVRKRLDTVEDELVKLGLIKKTELDYYPFRVKDLDGLKKKITEKYGKEYKSEIEKALAAAEKKKGEALTEIERDIVLNKVLAPLLGKPMGSHMPGFARARTIMEIPEDLQPFYHDPIEALNSYGVQSAKYIEKAKFFGQHLKTKKEGSQQFINSEESVGALVDHYRNRGELTDQQAFELGELLRDRFVGGEKVPHPYIQKMKNVVNGALLGNIYSAATQLGDLALQMALQGPRASVNALRRQITRSKYLDLSDLGLNEHVAHEFLSDDATRRFADWSFKWGGFRAIDATGKNFGLNAAISKMMRQAQTEKGIMELSNKFQRMFPDDFSRALTALKKGEVNEAVELLAFSELTKSQPLTGWELPQWYQANPNGRVLYHLQTFSLRVMNLAYEDGLRKIASGNAKKFREGAATLVKLGAALGIGGMATDKIKDMLSGRPIELSPEEIPVNALEALGISMYDYRQMQDKSPLEAVAASKMPPVLSMSSEVWREPGKLLAYTPIGGRVAYNRMRGTDWYQERVRKRRAEYGYKMQIDVPAKKDKDKNRSGSRSRDRGER